MTETSPIQNEQTTINNDIISSNPLEITSAQNSDIPEETFLTEGYVLDTEENIIYIDEQNPGNRTYIKEGLDRMIPYHIENAAIYVPDNLRTGISVSVIYYIKDGERIALQIESCGIELEPIYFRTSSYFNGTILMIQEDFIEILLDDGQTLKFNYHYAVMPDSYKTGDSVTFFARYEEPFLMYSMSVVYE